MTGREKPLRGTHHTTYANATAMHRPSTQNAILHRPAGPDDAIVGIGIASLPPPSFHTHSWWLTPPAEASANTPVRDSGELVHGHDDVRSVPQADHDVAKGDELLLSASERRRRVRVKNVRQLMRRASDALRQRRNFLLQHISCRVPESSSAALDRWLWPFSRRTTQLRTLTRPREGKKRENQQSRKAHSRRTSKRRAESTAAEERKDRTAKAFAARQLTRWANGGSGLSNSAELGCQQSGAAKSSAASGRRLRLEAIPIWV
eukprot:scaffold3229_cov246-Pinguiococcus_pyrenoidosus.AAC.3